MKTLKELRIGDTLFVYRPERKSTLEVRIEDIEEVVQGSSSVAIYFRVEDEGVYTVFIDPDYIQSIYSRRNINRPRSFEDHQIYLD